MSVSLPSTLEKKPSALMPVGERKADGLRHQVRLVEAYYDGKGAILRSRNGEEVEEGLPKRESIESPERVRDGKKRNERKTEQVRKKVIGR